MLRTLVLLVFLPFSAYAGEGVDTLEHFQKVLKTIQGKFVQTQYNTDGLPTQQASGSFELMRPGHFRWIYSQPYQQELVADGESLWVYDQDLEQATQKPLRQALGQAPIMLLLENRPLDDQFLLTDLGREQGMDWVELKPRNEQTDFREVKLAFRNDTLARMQLTDVFGQITLIEFADIKLNAPLDAERFTFTPPPGVDVVRALK